MNLVLDIGNTFAKVALIQDKEIFFSKSYKELTLKNLDAILSCYSPQKAIASIVGKIRPELINLIRSRITTIILDQNTPIPLKNQYNTPETLGYDRIAVAVAANSLYPNRNVLIIDAGTAITYELVTSDAVYLGGAISPGISLRFNALNSHTAKLPLLEKVENYPLIGQNTSECILSGVLNGVIGEIDAYIDNVKNIYPIETVLTGGDSNFLVDKLKNSIFVNQNLMTIGLNKILEFNLG
ncbi:type III pantothenate kinase [Tenuifilaceae bacterium CYCD]|nr:type III pantothenate kinase [Tenuifilaceae bacterium CYCD]